MVNQVLYSLKFISSLSLSISLSLSLSPSLFPFPFFPFSLRLLRNCRQGAETRQQINKESLLFLTTYSIYLFRYLFIHLFIYFFIYLGTY